MKASLIAAAGVLALGLVGCGNSKARVYNFAFDRSPLQNLAASCYDNNEIPPTKVDLSNEREEMTIVIWDGAEGKKYLDLGIKEYPLGDADPVIVDGLIESEDGKTFVGSRTFRNLQQPGSGFSDLQVSTVNVTFEELGAVARGTLLVKSDYACTSCPTNTKIATCSAQFTLNGRQVDYENIAVVPNGVGGGSL